MKFFKDVKLTQEINKDTFYFGILKVGETKRYTFYVLNEDKGYLRDIIFKLEHDREEREVKIIKAPISLDSKESGEIIFEWSPLVTIDEPLDLKIIVQGQRLLGNPVWENL